MRDENVGNKDNWSAWFGDFATRAAAKRHLTMVWTGPKVKDHAHWIDSEVRENADGRWQVRILEADFVESMKLGCPRCGHECPPSSLTQYGMCKTCKGKADA